MRQSCSFGPGALPGRIAAARRSSAIAVGCAALAAVAAAAADPVTPDDVAEVVAFADLEPGDKVAQFLPPSGDLVRLLCAAVGDAGGVYALSAPSVDAADADVPVSQDCPRLTVIVLRARSMPAPELHSDSDDPGWVYEYWTLRAPVESFVAPESLDLILIADRYHALHGSAYGSVSPIRVGATLLAALKPGGLLVIEDYASTAGSGARDAARLHRIDPEEVKTEMAAAGFELAGESSVLRDPQDSRRTNAHSVDHADRFVLKFRRP